MIDKFEVVSANTIPGGRSGRPSRGSRYEELFRTFDALPPEEALRIPCKTVADAMKTRVRIYAAFNNANYKGKVQIMLRGPDIYIVKRGESGWQDNSNPTCHTITEDTKAEAHQKARESVPCDCWQCKQDKAATNG